MPIYEYACESCGTKFEKLVRNGDAVECPSCSGTQLAQQWSTFSAQANGKPAEPMGGGCASGMCRMPDVCGRN